MINNKKCGSRLLIFPSRCRKENILLFKQNKESNVEDTVSVPAPRTPLNLEVSFKRNYAREATKGTLKNISISGAFLEFVGGEVRANEKIHLTFVVAGRERKVAASVIWTNSAGAGIKFLPVNNRDVQIVDDLIYYVENDRTGRRSMIDNIFKKVG
jgi:hypothetical protein